MTNNILDDINRCKKSSDYVKFARKYGATVREKNHYVITHKSGDVTTLSCTHGKQTPLHKTRKEFINIYIDTNSATITKDKFNFKPNKKIRFNNSKKNNRKDNFHNSY
jgi:hypothetical protein